MNKQEIEKVVKSLVENSKIANRPDINNNLIIKNNTLYLIKDGIETNQCDLSAKIIRKEIREIRFAKRNIFENSNAKYSPFEADRNENKYLWKEDYHNIDFPKIMPIMIFSLLETGKCPTIFETAYIYKSTYTERINLEDCNPNRNSLYAIPVRDNIDRDRVGIDILFENRKFKNELLKFKEEYTTYLRGFPINEFTTEQLYSRIYKAYASLIRDIYATLYFNELGAEATYSYYEDLNGIDCTVNGISVFAYTRTIRALEFRDKKANERHPELGNVGVLLQKDFSKKKSNKVYLIDEHSAKQVIDCANKLRNKELIGMPQVLF